jgi:hypothetical protein
MVELLVYNSYYPYHKDTLLFLFINCYLCCWLHAGCGYNIKKKSLYKFKFVLSIDPLEISSQIKEIFNRDTNAGRT